MKKIKITIYLAIVFIVALFFVNKDNEIYVASSDGIINLRMSQVSSENGAIGQTMEKFSDLIYERTNGRYKIKLFHNGQLGGERDAIENIKMGTLDLTVVNQAVLTNFVSDFSVLDIPYLFSGYEHADKVFLGPIGDQFKISVDNIGLKTLGIWESGFRNLTNSKKPIRSLSDVNELRIRTMENQTHQRFWRYIHTDPVPMAWSEAYTAMQQGAIDGQENPILVIDTNNVGKVNKNLAITEHAYSTVFIIMNPTLWKRLNTKDKEIFASTMKEMELYERKINRKMEKDSLEKLIYEGVKVTYPDKNEFIKESEGFIDSFNEKYGEMIKKIKETDIRG